MNRPLIIAHRGASHDAPENTLAAFRLAWEHGADAIETDLRLTADGEIVCFHDADGRRIFGNPRLIRDLSRTAVPAPTLDEMLAEAPPEGRIVLELKEPFVPPLGEFPAHRVTFIAFDPEVIATAKRVRPDIRALWLFGNHASIPRRRGPWLVDRVRELGVDGVDLRFGRRLHSRLLAPLREAGLVVFTYTVNRPHEIRRGARLGLDGITTDRPADARRWLEHFFRNPFSVRAPFSSEGCKRFA